MIRAQSYHTMTGEDTNVYHDHNDCRYGKRIKQQHREPGKARRRRCEECTRLDAARG
jgi:hypothetical protein